LTGTYDSNLRIKEIKSRKILLKNGEENSAKLNGMLITCRNIGDCSCIPTIAVAPDGRISYSCGECDSCEMTVTF